MAEESPRPRKSSKPDRGPDQIGAEFSAALAERTALNLVSRVVFLFISTALAVIDWSDFRATIIVVMAAVSFGFLWYLQLMAIRQQLANLRELLASRSMGGDGVEDDYIRRRYYSRASGLSWLLRYERSLWVALVMTIAMLRILVK